MKEPNMLFKIGQIATTCSISRATILRMEEDGLLVPARKDPESGYRYYSFENLVRVRQILYLRSLGFTTEVILHHLEKPTDPAPLIRDMEERVRQMTKTLWVLKQLAELNPPFSVNIAEVSERNCYVKNVVTSGSFGNLVAHVRNTMIEAVSKGIHFDRDRGILIATDRTDIVHGKYDEDTPYLYSIGVPTQDPPGGNIVTLPAGEVMTFLWDGDLSTLPEKGEQLYREAFLQHRLPIGPVGFEVILPLLSLSEQTGEETANHFLIRFGFAVAKVEET